MNNEENDPRANQIPHLLDQITAMLKIIEENSDKVSNIPPETFERLNNLGKIMKKFRETTIQSYEEIHLNMDKMTRETLANPKLEAEQRAILIRERQLEDRARNMKRKFDTLLEQMAAMPKMLRQQPEKVVKRHRKFKRLGSKKDWKPL